MTNDRFLNEKDVVISKKDLYKDISINGIPVSINLKDMTPKDVILKSLTNITELTETKILESIKKSVYIPCLYIRYNNEREYESYSLIESKDGNRKYLDWFTIDRDIEKMNEIVIPVYTNIDYNDFINKDIIDIKTYNLDNETSDDYITNIYIESIDLSDEALSNNNSDESGYFIKRLTGTKVVNYNGKALIYLNFTINKKPKTLSTEHNVFRFKLKLYFSINNNDYLIYDISRMGEYTESTYQIMSGGNSSTTSSKRWVYISNDDDNEPKFDKSSTYIDPAVIDPPSAPEPDPGYVVEEW